MATKWFTVVRYLISPEESRPGRTDFWNSVFLAERSPLGRSFLEISKVSTLIAFSMGMTMVLARL